jgi:hypothetical protein
VRLQADYLLVLWARVWDGTLPYTDFLTEFPTVQALIRHWLTQGLSASSSRTAATCRQLLDHDISLWLFATVPDVEPTNNSAKRALRHPVIWRRTSHGTQPDLGSQFVERILSAVETFASNSVPSSISCVRLSLPIVLVCPLPRSCPFSTVKMACSLPSKHIQLSVPNEPLLYNSTLDK